MSSYLFYFTIFGIAKKETIQRCKSFEALAYNAIAHYHVSMDAYSKHLAVMSIMTYISCNLILTLIYQSSCTWPFQ